MQIDVHYIQACKSVEKYLYKGRIIFVYNDQGLYFDVFFSEEKVKAFFDNKIYRGDLFFYGKQDLDNYFDSLN